MTKQDLLMAAARAYWGDEIDDVCSIEWSEQDDAVLYTHGDNQDHNGRDRTYRWDPLEEDADALPLAVKLRLWLRYRNDSSVNVCWYDERGIFAGNVTEEYGSLRNGDEANAHVRRAIVRAAAEIWRTAETRARADSAALVVARGRP